jgi:putative transposon-encoded protein
VDKRGINMKFEVEGDESRRFLVKHSGNGGYIYLPKTWIGKEVEVILLPDMIKETCVLQKGIFNIPIRFSLGFNSEKTELWDGLSWINNHELLMKNQTYRDSEKQEDWENFIKDVGKLLEDPTFFEWNDDLAPGQSHVFENGISLFKQF